MTGKKKNLSIGAAMKQRMGQGDAGTLATPAPDAPPAPQPVTPPPPAEALESFNPRLPAGLHRRLKMQAASEGRKIQDVVQEALIAYLGKQESK
mgnify:CR=1 FL=1